MAKNTLAGKVALITGASSGIGAAMAVEYARLGADVVLTARRADRLEEVAEKIRDHGRRALVVNCDVTSNGDLENAVSEAMESFGRIDRVIANAGFGVAKPLAKLGLEDYRRQFETNVFGVLRTVFATLGSLEQSRGCLAIIGSVSGYIAMPGSSPYSMSKAAVHKLAESLRFELARSNVGVTLIVPGFVVSEIRKVDNQGVYRPDARDRIPGWLPMDTDVAAQKIVRAVERRKRILVMTGHGRFAVLFQRYFPGLLSALIGRSGNRFKREKS